MLDDTRSRTTEMSDTPHAVSVLQDLGRGTIPTSKRYEPGHLQMLRLLRERVISAGRSAGALTELVFDARPASGSSPVHQVRIVFEPDGAPIPQAELEPEEHLLKLYYPASELERLRQLLRSGRDRLCYFWQGPTPSRVHAWLFTSP